MITSSPMAENLTRNFLSSRDKEGKKMSIFKLKLTPAAKQIGIRKPNDIYQRVCSLGDICSSLLFNCQVSCSEIKRIISHYLILLSISPYFTAENSACFVVCTEWIHILGRPDRIVLKVFFWFLSYASFIGILLKLE